MTLEPVFSPVVHGAISTLLGVAMLAVSQFDFIVRLTASLLFMCTFMNTRVVRLAKNDFGSVFGSVSVFTKLTAVSVFFSSVRPTFVSGRRRRLSFMPLQYDARIDVLPC